MRAQHGSDTFMVREVLHFVLPDWKPASGAVPPQRVDLIVEPA
jgi:hypothetical protein